MWWKAFVHCDSALCSSRGVGLQKCFVMRGRTVWEAVVLLWERGQGERERSRRQHVRAPHFPMGHRS